MATEFKLHDLDTEDRWSSHLSFSGLLACSGSFPQPIQVVFVAIPGVCVCLSPNGRCFACAEQARLSL